ncbi:DUF1643 domain-containing protein [Virgibacillus sp. DJP39]|uniref:DUF1643 domain-containing protein n=1 Tax=Virgibacillus sp. DJP39 TaxID=3409790 RepID=UPI003BB58FDA
MTVIKWKDNENVDAKLDESGENRYLLTCTWERNKPSVTFIMLNPSVRLVEAADRTLRRCINFSKSWGYGSMQIVNLFSQVATDPSDLRTPTAEELRKNDNQIKK